MLKKTTLAVMGLTASGFIFAGTMGPVCTPGNVTVACEARHWSLGLQGLYLNIAEGANRSYRLAAAAPAVIPLNNQWDWGYKAEGSFQFNTGNDVIVNWTHFNSTLRQGGFATPFSVEAIVPYGLNNQSRFDQVNVAMGQSVDFSVTNKMRVYGGLQYANIQENDTNIFPAPLPFRTAPNLGGTYYDNTNYKGVGPVIGVDYAYDLT
ncbi:MAG: Lpg1974 family pore-forming outer membrane protein, partial [bacterium]|nr:Lpg1974 family pore-forming outer membrane protein [bacterium]